MKNCTGTGETECRTEFETSCSTKYRDEAVLDTKCVKIPVKFCGEGCRMTAGEKVMMMMMVMSRTTCLVGRSVTRRRLTCFTTCLRRCVT